MTVHANRVNPGAPVAGLVLAGGFGQRLGQDKGQLVIHGGQPQAVWACELLRQVCTDVWVSIRAAQSTLEPYRQLPVIIDPLTAGQAPLQGPATGLLSAWRAFPDKAWLLLAVDMAWVDIAMLRALLSARQQASASAPATAFRHADGTPEPLCALWEPRVRPLVEARVRATGRTPSLRRLLEGADVTLLAAPDPARLRSVNVRADLAELQRQV